MTAVVMPLMTAPGAQAADQVRTGLTESTALASCWDVKQTNPAAKDGIYWLYTPALGYPQRFYCDMTTDGGGWVLIGRGRQGWNFTAAGQGLTSDVSATVIGSAAFDPRHLTNDVVNALLDNQPVASLDDGLRVRRAADAAGTKWQDARMKLSTMGSWSWALGGGYDLSRYSFDGTSYPGGSSKAACADGAFQCVSTVRSTANRYLPGFAYGAGVTGSTATTSYLWAPADGAGSAVPFAQASLRPRLRFGALSFPAVGSTGLPGFTNRSVFDDYAQPQPYGVSGLANGFSTAVGLCARSVTLRPLFRVSCGVSRAQEAQS